MAGEAFRRCTFQELIDDGVLEIGDGYRAKNEELGGSGPMFLRAGHVTDSHIDFEGVERFRAVLADKVQPKMARAGDTIITTKGNSTGRTSFVTERMPSFVYSPHLSYWRSRDSKQLANGFLRYWSRSSEFVKQLSGMKASTDMAPYLSLTDQRRLKITLPPADEQQAIACILGALDDKIELNRWMNRTLEGLARALFQSWFVDFDPVRAKAAGHTPPGLGPHLAKLFPDAFEGSELGRIPQGWKVSTIGQLSQITIGGDWGEDNPFDGATEAICLRGVDLEHLRFGGWANAPRRWFKPSSIEKRQLGEHDVLIAGSGAGPTGRPLWATAQLHRLWGLPVIYSNFCKRLRCETVECAVYLDRCLQVMRESGEIWEYVNGTSLPNLDAHSLLRGKFIVIPDQLVLRAFFQTVEPITQRHFSAESRALTALRDTLLPKLISGELRVPDAARIVERATA
jgi:type I restriction enzyme S subunit